MSWMTNWKCSHDVSVLIGFPLAVCLPVHGTLATMIEGSWASFSHLLLDVLTLPLPEIQAISNVSPGGSPSALSFWFTFTFTVYRSLEIRSRNMYTLKLSSPSCHTMHDTMHDMWNIAWHSSLPIDLQTKEKHARHKSQCHARVLQ